MEWKDCSNFGYGDMSSCKARCRAVPECKYANYDASQNMCGKNGYCKITKSSVLGAIGNWGWGADTPQALLWASFTLAASALALGFVLLEVRVATWLPRPAF